MLSKFAAAVIAASLIAGPVLAQGTSIAPANATIQPAAKADAGKAGVTTNVKADAKVDAKANVKTDAVKTTTVKVKKAKKHSAVQTKKHAKHVKQVKHVKHVKHLKHLAKIKTAG
jgi:hypothetical protein